MIKRPSLTQHLTLLFAITLLMGGCMAGRPLTSDATEILKLERPDQLPHSRIAYGTRNIKAAWLADPTDRYAHGVLGDDLEAATLVVETRTGKELRFKLPRDRVFEDLQPRLVNLIDNQDDEIMVVESDADHGASLAIYAVIDGQLKPITSTPFIGRSSRWLNPVGIGDFDGDGTMDVALVSTPHIGGKLRLYRQEGGRLKRFAEYSGVSTHSIGSTELGLGQVVPHEPRDRILLPDQARHTLMLMEWSGKDWKVISEHPQPSDIVTSLEETGMNSWRFGLRNGMQVELTLNP